MLYLNDATFTGEDGAVLADVVRSVHQAKLPILMLPLPTSGCTVKATLISCGNWYAASSRMATVSRPGLPGVFGYRIVGLSS